jgi:restriction system protein
MGSRKLDRPEDLDGIRQLTWQQFAMILGEAFRRRGYSMVANGGVGIDLVLRKDDEDFYVQCKQWKVLKVAVKPLRELFDAMSARGVAGGFFVTSGMYTEEARAFAKESGIELIDGIGLAQMVKEAQAPEPFLDPTIGRRPLNTTFTASSTVPACPRCNGEMVRRSAQSAANAGNEIWGCSRYPQCRGTRPV